MCPNEPTQQAGLFAHVNIKRSKEETLHAHTSLHRLQQML